MALWLARAGSTGEHEEKFLQDNTIYLTWSQFNVDLNGVENWGQLLTTLQLYYDDENPKRIQNWASQIWGFSKEIKPNDWVVLPSKFSPVLHFGKVTSNYTFNPAADDPYFHSIKVEWFARNVPRTAFDQDILYSMGAFLTICRIQRNDAEERIHMLYQNNWVRIDSRKEDLKFALNSKGEKSEPKNLEDIAEETPVDLEELAYDQIGRYLESKFRTHDMERIIKGILKAKGYEVFHSPKGTDKGVDLLASAGPYGFGHPRICVQVKTGKDAVSRTVVDQLIGTMANFNAEYGIFVSWNGFKNSADVRQHFFKIRFWDKNDIIRELLDNYNNLDVDLKNELGFKQIWTVSF